MEMPMRTTVEPMKSAIKHDGRSTHPDSDVEARAFAEDVRALVAAGLIELRADGAGELRVTAVGRRCSPLERRLREV